MKHIYNLKKDKPDERDYILLNDFDDRDFIKYNIQPDETIQLMEHDNSIIKNIRPNILPPKEFPEK